MVGDSCGWGDGYGGEVIVGVMVIVGEVANSAGIYRTIREGCPFFVEVRFVFGDLRLGFYLGISFWGFSFGFLSGDLLLGCYLGISGKSVSPVLPLKRRREGY